jgi:hypothetical protein
VGDGTNSRIGLAVARGLARRNGAVGETVAAAAGILADGADGVCRDGTFGLAKGTCVAEAAGDVSAGLEIGGEGSIAACVGFTKVLAGASGGGVDSDLIFARAFSAACRSAIPSQP